MICVKVLTPDARILLLSNDTCSCSTATIPHRTGLPAKVVGGGGICSVRTVFFVSLADVLPLRGLPFTVTRFCCVCVECNRGATASCTLRQVESATHMHAPAVLPPERPGTHCVVFWVGPRAGQNAVKKMKILLLLLGIEPSFHVAQSTAWWSHTG